MGTLSRNSNVSGRCSAKPPAATRRRAGQISLAYLSFTCHVTTSSHAPVSRAPRVRSRLGVVQNERFSGPHARQFAPWWANSGKNPEKMVKNEMENGARWRFLEGLKRHFAVPGADGARSQPASLPDFTSVASDWIEPAAAPGSQSGAPFFTDVGTDRHLRAITSGHGTRAIAGLC